MDPETFEACIIHASMFDNTEYYRDVRYTKEGRLEGFYIQIKTIGIEDPGLNGPKLLADLRQIVNEYGLDDSYIYAQEFPEFEIYRVIESEVVKILTYALLTVTVVVLFITFNFRVTFFVVFVVFLVVIYMTGIGYFWGLHLNNAFSVNLGFAMGIAIDYSVHISHRYLTTKPPASCTTDAEKRKYKITKAISQMGSSVFHGGFSTLLAISVMAFATLYTFKVFWKTWTIMIVFGMLNGMILQPVILSFFGPIENTEHNQTQTKRRIITNKSKINPTDLESDKKQVM